MKNKDFYNNYIKLFLETNSKINLISKNDEKYLWEKHIYDSLAIEKVFEKYGIPKTILDIGTGGGFPAMPIAITYPQIQVVGVDSIAKKIKAVDSIKESLGINNLSLICERAENLKTTYDLITSRAVSSLKNISAYAFPLLKKRGYFIAYKSIKTMEEIKNAGAVLKKYNAKVVDIINYKLPIEKDLTRNLIVLQKQ